MMAAAMENLVTERQRRYLAYLLRLWQIQDKGKIGWRASLENAHTGEKLAFAHLDELVAFLRERIGLAPPAEQPGRSMNAHPRQIPYRRRRIRMNMENRFAVLLLMIVTLLLLVACGAPQPAATDPPIAMDTTAPTDTPIPPDTPVPTSAPAVTDTAFPTDTPIPTEPPPPPTETPEPQPEDRTWPTKRESLCHGLRSPDRPGAAVLRLRRVCQVAWRGSTEMRTQGARRMGLRCGPEPAGALGGCPSRHLQPGCL